MSKKVLILRGIPGCGKTHWAIEKHTPKGRKICSADHFFIDDRTGDYNFDLALLGQAHSACLGNFIEGLYNSLIDVLIVDNTNIHIWEWQNYYKLAIAARVDHVEVHEWVCETLAQVKLCHARCQHDVPLDLVARMAMEFQPYRGPTMVHAIDG
jgi:hypothetical protein